jgi:hypothetical protein
MLTEQLRTAARRGDWIRVHATAHTAPRLGQIIGVEGPPGHECFRVRWEDDVESLFVPADGDRVIRGNPYAGNRPG